MADYGHLSEETQSALTLSNEERIRGIREARWITYTRAKHILDRLEDLLSYPQTHRVPCLLIVGATNNGKTAIVNRFERLHAAADLPEGDAIHVPVLSVQAPPVPDENRFYAAILNALHAPYKISDPPGRRQIEVLHVLRGIGLRMLIIDEIHHIVAGHIAKQRIFLNVLKYLANELRVPLIGVGTIDAFRALQTDPQLANRFEPIGLPPWELNREFQMLLASFERTLPLRKRSGLTGERLATKLLAMSEGTIGEITSLLITSAIQAITTGKEQINGALLDSLEWDPPSERNRRVEKLG